MGWRELQGWLRVAKAQQEEPQPDPYTFRNDPWFAERKAEIARRRGF